MSVRKPVGNVTAYAAAVRGGYTGTYEEFCAEQAGFAKNAQQVAEDKTAVEKIKSDVEQLKTDAVSEVGTAKSDAVGAVAAAGSTAVKAVEDTGAGQVSEVRSAGEANVDAVNTAGAAQVKAVEDTASEKIEEIGRTGAVVYGAEQELAETEQVQARTNIGAASQTEVTQLSEEIDEHGVLIEGKQPLGEYALKEEIPTSAEDVGAATQDYVDAEITKLKAQGVQQTPLYANSIEECTDTSKLYVLPDGYIYAYILAPKSYTNQIPLSIDSDGNVVGLIENHRYNSSDTLVAQSGVNATGFIPVKTGDKIYFENINFRNETINGVTSGAYYIRTYDKYFNIYKGLSGATVANITTTDAFDDITVDDVGNLKALTVTYIDAGYIRMAFIPVDGKEAIITVNEEIAETPEYRWTNTGHAFVPADYEERIIAVEEQSAENTADIADINDRVSVLESGETVTELPDYWKTAIDALSDKVIEKQHNGGVDSFQFIWFADLHGVNGATNTNGAGTSSQKYIGHISQYAAEKYDIPFVAIAGDIMSQASHAAESSIWAEYSNIRKLLAPIDSDRLIYTKGNHDGAWGAPVDGVYYLNNIGGRKVYDAIFRRQATDRGRVFGGDGSYFYIDSPQKMRFVMLNGHTDGDGSTDDNGYAVYNSMKNGVFGTEQLAWLASVALDLPEDWGAVIMAHHPLTVSKDGSLVAGILDAYNNRTAYSGTIDLTDTYWGNGLTTDYNTSTVDVNFADAKSEVIAYFYGHIHKDTIDSTTYSFPCISITTSSADVRDSDPVERVVGTATETALDIVTIDRLNRMIYMTRIGAGYDREIDY